MDTCKKYLAYYTCFYGSNNNIAFKIPELPSNKYECYYYTNNTDLYDKLLETKWIRIFIDKPTTDDVIESCMAAKEVKVLPEKYKEIQDYEYTVFLDSKLNLLNESLIENFIETYFVQQDYALLLRRHWYINNVWDEFNESLRYHQRYRMHEEIYRNYINEQINSGLSVNTNDIHCACGLLIRNMKHPKMKEIDSLWYEHINKCGIQDQISFFFAKQFFDGYIHAFGEYPFLV